MNVSGHNGTRAAAVVGLLPRDSTLATEVAQGGPRGACGTVAANAYARVESRHVCAMCNARFLISICRAGIFS